MSGGEDDAVRLSVRLCCVLDLVEPLVELFELAELVLVEEVRSAVWRELVVLRAWMVVHTSVRPPDWNFFFEHLRPTIGDDADVLHGDVVAWLRIPVVSRLISFCS